MARERDSELDVGSLFSCCRSCRLTLACRCRGFHPHDRTRQRNVISQHCCGGPRWVGSRDRCRVDFPVQANWMGDYDELVLDGTDPAAAAGMSVDTVPVPVVLRVGSTVRIRPTVKEPKCVCCVIASVTCLYCSSVRVCTACVCGYVMPGDETRGSRVRGRWECPILAHRRSIRVSGSHCA